MGFDSVRVTDHLLVPRTLDIIYRDNMLEPLAMLSYLAAPMCAIFGSKRGVKANPCFLPVSGYPLMAYRTTCCPIRSVPDGPPVKS